MLNTSSPYMQSSANQFLETLERIIEVYTNAVLVVGVLLLALLVWLCVSELRQSRQRRRANRPPLASRVREADRPAAVRGLLEESSI